jgi:hypothetical protein
MRSAKVLALLKAAIMAAAAVMEVGRPGESSIKHALGVA